jgi:hypothetical protein
MRITAILLSLFLFAAVPVRAQTAERAAAGDSTRIAPDPERTASLSPWALRIQSETATELTSPYGESLEIGVELSLPTPRKWSASVGFGSSVYVNEELSTGPDLTFEVSVSRSIWKSD